MVINEYVHGVGPPAVDGVEGAKIPREVYPEGGELRKKANLKSPMAGKSIWDKKICQR